jgi:hypothetical protein
MCAAMAESTPRACRGGTSILRRRVNEQRKRQRKELQRKSKGEVAARVHLAESGPAPTPVVAMIV